ncbi:MAG TPA: restriction endonuclease subunit S [Phycisphaerales bacterium]|nr:restriction endonuclease subunit S [Phycisphaerales bacterium]
MEPGIRFPRYDVYKDSGAGWLGKIPCDWSIKSIRAVTQLKSEKNQPDLQVLSVYREHGVIIKDSRDDNHNATSLDTSGYKVVDKGDLVVNKMKAWQGSMGVSDHYGLVSPAYITCRVDTERVYPKFLHYLLRSKPYIGIYNALSYGVRVGQWDMHYEDFKHIPIPIPEKKTQDRIADFLDQKTAEIDKAVAKKQRLIELLKEQKAILINQAVTRGMNPDAPMRDSGVEWIGEIPAHWEVKKLKYFSEVQSGITLGKLYSENTLISVPYLRVANVQDGYFKLDDVAELQLPRRIITQYLVRVGDILVTEGGDIDKLGRGNVWTGEIENCIHQNHIFAIRVKQNIASEYFISLATGVDYGRRYFTHTANKTTNLASTNRTKLGNFPIALPPINEQLSIVEYANGINSKYDLLIKIVQKEMSHLNEFKQTIISNAVTGKIKI